ncbi:MAG TPA: HAD-IA family hydrolase [Thermoanaerobaculia bacterium]
MADGALPPGIRAVIFDAGGTLIHLDGERVCGAVGVPFEPERFRDAESAAVAAVRAFMLSHRESKDAERVVFYFDHMLSRLGLTDAKARGEAGSRVADEHRRANLWSRPGAGAAETLAELAARRYRMAVVSNADGRVRGLLQDAGVIPWLEFVVDSAEVGLEKPDPRIFHAATERLGLPPASCAYVGDIYEIDVEGARRAGLHPVLIGEGPAPEGVLRVRELSGLLPLLPGFA